MSTYEFTGQAPLPHLRRSRFGRAVFELGADHGVGAVGAGEHGGEVSRNLVRQLDARELVGVVTLRHADIRGAGFGQGGVRFQAEQRVRVQARIIAGLEGNGLRNVARDDLGDGVLGDEARLPVDRFEMQEANVVVDRPHKVGRGCNHQIAAQDTAVDTHDFDEQLLSMIVT